MPPDINLLEDFEEATNCGYVVDPFKGREPFSLQFRDNHPFDMSDGSDKYSQMSLGYTLPFLYSKFAFAFSIVPFLLYAIYAGILFVTSDGCKSDYVIDQIVNNVTDITKIDVIRQLVPESPIPNAITSIANTPGTNSTFRNYQYLNCFIVDKTDKCDALSRLDCKDNYSEECERANLEAYLETYIDGMCRRNPVSIFSASNFLYEGGNKRNALFVGQAVAVALGLAMVSFFYYLHERKIRKYALHNTTIENYSVLLLGLKRLAAPNLG